MNLLLEENHYSVNGKKQCSFSEGQDINQEEYSVVINHSDVLGINDVILNPKRKSALIDKGSIHPFLQECDHKQTSQRKERQKLDTRSDDFFTVLGHIKWLFEKKNLQSSLSLFQQNTRGLNDKHEELICSLLTHNTNHQIICLTEHYTMEQK